jgi:TM2 domain-containing membrane protein YozV
MSSPDDRAMGPQNSQSWGAGPAYGASDPYAAPAYGGPAAPGHPAVNSAASFGATGQPAAVVAVKTPGIAILLSFIWLGAGHLYAGRTGLGLGLMAVNLFLLLFLMIPLIGWVLSPLAWIGLFIYAAISSNNAVKQHNARWGVARY